MKQALGLIRVSTDSQDTQRQRTDLKRLEKMYGIHIVHTLELVGVSGTTMLTNEADSAVAAGSAATGHRRPRGFRRGPCH